MHLLVTGGTGFVGTSVVEYLVSRGHQVTVFVRRQDSSVGQSYISGDITNLDSLTKSANSLDKIDAIVHLATCKQSDRIMDVLDTNCTGLSNLLLLTSAFQVKHFVNVSSISVVGTPQFSPIDESHPCEPKTIYQASKLLAERILDSYQTDVCTRISLRITAPIGKNMPEDRFLSHCVRAAVSGSPISVYGQGLRRQNYIDVSDVCLGIELALHSGAEGPVILGGAKSYTNLELARLVVSVLDSNSTVQHGNVHDPEDALDWHVDIGLAKRLLGYEPSCSMMESIRRIASC
jgi:nucleoside-diphosphate-sugar epimerase